MRDSSDRDDQGRLPMIVLISSRTGEVELSGNREDLVGLAGVLRAGEGEVELDQVSDPARTTAP